MTLGPDGAVLRVEAKLSTPLVTVQIARLELRAPVDDVLAADDAYRLDLCVTSRPRETRACFPDRWGPSRFEPVGDLFHVPPGHALHFRGDRGRQASIMCRLTRAAVDPWLEGGLGWTDRRLEAGLEIVNPHIRNLLLRLAEEAYLPGFASATLADMAASQLGLELARTCVAIDDGPAAGGLAGWRLRVIDERIREPPAPTLSELAALCNLSVRQLTRGFRASRGCSIHDHLAHGRVEGAKRLLAGDHSIKSVAFATGFASASSFAFAFRRVTGATPREFRQRLHRATH